MDCFINQITDLSLLTNSFRSMDDHITSMAQAAVSALIVNVEQKREGGKAKGGNINIHIYNQ